MNFKTIFAILIAPVIFSSCAAESKIHDFDMICGYFSELKVTLDSSEMNYEQRNDFIMERILANLPETSNARVAWEAISAADSTERYGLFKSIADDIQNINWQCESMKELAASSGLFE